MRFPSLRGMYEDLSARYLRDMLHRKRRHCTIVYCISRDTPFFYLDGFAYLIGWPMCDTLITFVICDGFLQSLNGILVFLVANLSIIYLFIPALFLVEMVFSFQDMNLLTDPSMSQNQPTVAISRISILLSDL
jgi:hypothetical protein